VKKREFGGVEKAAPGPNTRLKEGKGGEGLCQDEEGRNSAGESVKGVRGEPSTETGRPVVLRRLRTAALGGIRGTNNQKN